MEFHHRVPRHVFEPFPRHLTQPPPSWLPICVVFPFAVRLVFWAGRLSLIPSSSGFSLCIFLCSFLPLPDDVQVSLSSTHAVTTKKRVPLVRFVGELPLLPQSLGPLAHHLVEGCLGARMKASTNKFSKNGTTNEASLEMAMESLCGSMKLKFHPSLFRNYLSET